MRFEVGGDLWLFHVPKVTPAETSATDFPDGRPRVVPAGSRAVSSATAPRPAHVGRTRNDEADLAAPQVAFDLWNPVAVARFHQADVERGQIAKRFAIEAFDRAHVAVAPGLDQILPRTAARL